MNHRQVVARLVCAVLLTVAGAAHAGMSVLFNPRLNQTLSTSTLQIDVQLQQFTYQNISLDGTIHCMVSVVKPEVVKVSFTADTLSVNSRPMKNIKGELLLSDKGIIVKGIEFDSFLVSGKIDLKQNLLDLSGEMRLTPINTVFDLFSAKPILQGMSTGRIRIEGALDAPYYKGYLAVESGTLREFPFSEAMFNFSGNYPFCLIENSYLKADDVKYMVEGMLGVNELADMSHVTMNISPEKVVIDGWKISQQRGATDSVVISKKGGSNFSFNVNGNSNESTEQAPTGVEFKKTLGSDKFFKFKVNNSSSSLVVGKEIGF